MSVRTLVLLTLLGGCAGHATPTTMARIDSLPDEHVAREQRLESTEARPGPETQKGKSKDFVRAETAAATAAAIVGSIFSTTKTVTIGVSQPIDENEILQPGYRDNERPKKNEAAEQASYDAGQLTPWVKLKKPDADPK